MSARAASAARLSLPVSAPAAVQAAFAATGLGICVVWAWHDGGFAPEEWLPGGLLLLALLCTAAASAEVRARLTARPLPLVLFGLYVAWSYLSILWAQVPADALDGANRTLVYWLVFALFTGLGLSERLGSAIVLAWGVALAALGVIELVRGGNRHNELRPLRSGASRGADQLSGRRRGALPLRVPHARGSGVPAAGEGALTSCSLCRRRRARRLERALPEPRLPDLVSVRARALPRSGAQQVAGVRARRSRGGCGRPRRAGSAACVLLFRNGTRGCGSGTARPGLARRQRRAGGGRFGRVGALRAARNALGASPSRHRDERVGPRRCRRRLVGRHRGRPPSLGPRRACLARLHDEQGGRPHQEPALRLGIRHEPLRRLADRGAAIHRPSAHRGRRGQLHRRLSPRSADT